MNSPPEVSRDREVLPVGFSGVAKVGWIESVRVSLLRGLLSHHIKRFRPGFGLANPHRDTAHSIAGSINTPPWMKNDSTLLERRRAAVPVSPV